MNLHSMKDMKEYHVVIKWMVGALGGLGSKEEN